jgi:hypothetical protein
MKIRIAVIGLIALFPSLVLAQNLTFSRSMKVGDWGTDVEMLQVVLNSDVRTQVAESGPGSKGAETSYFGLRTRDALRRYQELHASEVLVPAGLSQGTGYFGPATRAFVNAQGTNLSAKSQGGSYKDAHKDFVSSSPVGTTGATSGVGAKPTAKPLTAEDILPGFTKAVSVASSTSALRPRITGTSPAKVTNGTQVTIMGTNFSTTSNKIFSFFGPPIDIASTDGTSLTFVYHFTTNINDALKSTDAKKLFAPVGTSEIFQIATDYGVASARFTLDI